MLLNLLLFVIGLAGLYFGAEWLVGGSARIAAHFGVSSFIVGLTLVSFGTSAPELVVSGLASFRGNGALAVGNVLGSNVANIALILGIAALISAIDIRRELIVRDIPIMIGFALLVPLLGFNSVISRLEGGFLLILFVGYLAYLGVHARRQSLSAAALVEEQGIEAAPGPSVKRDLGIALVGLVLLAVGANLLVESAIEIATVLRVPEVVIGLTLVAFGTSLPELAASISAARRGEGEIVIGNVVGSNIFNIALILGVAALIRPLPISDSVLRADAPIVIGLSFLMIPLVLTSRRIQRVEGGLLFLAYVGFVAWLTM